MRAQQRTWRSIVLALVCAGCLGGQTGDPGAPKTTAGCPEPTKTLELATARSAGALPGTWLDAVMGGGSFQIELAAPQTVSATLTLSPARSVLVLAQANNPAAQLEDCPDSVRVQFDAELTLADSSQSFSGSAWLSPVPEGTAQLALSQLGRCTLSLDATGRPSKVTCP